VTDLTPRQIVDAIRRGLDETAREFDKKRRSNRYRRDKRFPNARLTNSAGFDHLRSTAGIRRNHYAIHVTHREGVADGGAEQPA
jgi:hypothetical protein